MMGRLPSRSRSREAQTFPMTAVLPLPAGEPEYLPGGRGTWDPIEPFTSPDPLPTAVAFPPGHYEEQDRQMDDGCREFLRTGGGPLAGLQDEVLTTTFCTRRLGLDKPPRSAVTYIRQELAEGEKLPVITTPGIPKQKYLEDMSHACQVCAGVGTASWLVVPGGKSACEACKSEKNRKFLFIGAALLALYLVAR